MMMIAPHAQYPAYCISSLHLAHLQVLHRIMGTCIMNTTKRERSSLYVPCQMSLMHRNECDVYVSAVTATMVNTNMPRV